MVIAVKYGGAVSSVIMLAALARVLDPELFGYYGIVFSLGTMLAVLGSFGQRMAVLKFGSEYLLESDERKLVGLIRFGYSLVVLGTLGFGFVSLLGMAVYFKSDLVYLGVATILFSLAIGLSEYQSSILRCLDSLAFAMLPRDVFWRVSVAGACVVYVFYFGADASASWFIIVPAAMLLVIVVVQNISYPRIRLSRIFFAPSTYEFPAWSRASLPMWGTSALNNGGPSFAVVIMGGVLSPAVAGGLFLAIKLSDATSLAVRGLFNVIVPQIGRLSYKGDDEGLQRVVTTSTLLSTAFSFVSFLFFLVLGKAIMRLFGAEFTRYYDELIVLSAFSLFSSALGPGAPLMAMRGYESASLKISIVTTALGLSCVLVFSWYFGALGAALGLGVYRVSSCMARAVFVGKNVGIDLFLLTQLRRRLAGTDVR